MNYAAQDRYVGVSTAKGRAEFITRTYLHLFGAIAAFAAFDVMLFQLGLAQAIAAPLLRYPLVITGGFIVAGWLFSRMAHSTTSRAMQYVGLGAYVVANAVLFVPLLFMANHYAPGAIQSAATVTLLGFAALTFVAFSTRKDFSFLGGFLRFAFLMVLVLIGASFLFGFQLGTFFSVAMVGLAGAAILYDTSNVLRHFPEDAYVGAALQLFSSVAMMFWYVLQLFISSRD